MGVRSLKVHQMAEMHLLVEMEGVCVCARAGPPGGAALWILPVGMSCAFPGMRTP